MTNENSSGISRYAGSEKGSETALISEKDVIEVRIDDEPNIALSSPSAIPDNNNNNTNGTSMSTISYQNDKAERKENVESTSVCMGLPGGAFSNMMDCCYGKEDERNENKENEGITDSNQEWEVHPENDYSNEIDCMLVVNFDNIIVFCIT